jgi:hypothetical protein
MTRGRCEVRMTTTTAIENYRNARALLADAMRRNDQAAKDLAKVEYLAALEQLRSEEGAA